jgi:geranyl-CoA carboxylase alpha subunit
VNPHTTRSETQSLHTLLVANRGEIAAHILRTASAMGLGTVAVYSDADAGAPWLSLADQALHIGGSPATQSYLCGDKVLQAARDSGANGIHPGYGFLSENADFAQSVLDAGLFWVGPPPAAMRAMADKAQAKATMHAAGVPILPGYREADQSLERLTQAAQILGFPLLVKATAGGGGRGMRRVDTPSELEDALSSAAREAQSAFGDGTLMLERLCEQARHIEVQILADTHGQVLHLGERDCSAQRRRQKVIEESPAPHLKQETRDALCQAAVEAARAVGYVGAGTVEFLADDSGFYFLEMNTRLQVEFAVTEARFGLDLVQWQLRVAQGERLPASVALPVGAAIEVRLCAEDPSAGFAPQTGVIHTLHLPKGVRCEMGIAQGSEISVFYDPMIAKLIAHAPTRELARHRLIQALEQTQILGVGTNRDWLLRLLKTPEFVAGGVHTQTLDAWQGTQVYASPEPTPLHWAVAALALNAPTSHWFRSSGHSSFGVPLLCADQEQSVQLQPGTPFALQVGEQSFELSMQAPNGWVQLQTAVGSRRIFCHKNPDGQSVSLDLGGQLLQIQRKPAAAPKLVELDPSRCLSPIAGSLSRIEATVGQRVQAGDTLARIEAMKLETRILAPADGVVAEILCEIGSQVAAGDTLIRLESENG